MSDEPDAEVEQITDVNKLDSRLSRIEAVIEKFVGGAHKDATTTTEERLSVPGDVASEVQRELARRDEETKKAERDAELGRLSETVKTLTEKTPEAPIRRVEQFMGWRRG